MDEKFQKIYVGTNEGITSVVDCLVNSLEKDMLLVIPPENKNFQNLITLKLLKREAATLGKNIIIISSNSAIKKMAPKVGLRTIDYFQIEENQPEIFYEEKQEKSGKISDILPPSVGFQKSAKRMPIFEDKSDDFIEEERQESGKSKFLEKFALKKEEESIKQNDWDFEDNSAEGKIDSSEELIEKKDNHYSKKGSPILKNISLAFSGNKVFVYVLSVIAVAIVLFAFVSLPKAKVEITPKIENISFDLSMELDKNVSETNVSQKKIPAQLIQIEREAKNTFSSSGRKTKESRATGIITAYNNYNSSSQSLVATTRFISESGKLFRTTTTVNIPGATVSGDKIIPSTQDVEVVAAEPGEDYNIGPSTFSIPGFAGTPKYTGFYGKSNNAMSGGFRGEVKFITKDDIKSAEDSLQKQLVGLKDEITSKIPQGLKLIDGASEIKFEEASAPKVGDEGEKFEITFKGIASALVFNEEEVKKLIEQTISGKIVADKKALPKTQKITYAIKSINLKDGKASLSIKAEEGITGTVDMDSLKNELASKNISEVKNYLSSLTSIENARVTLWPFWIKKFPSSPDKIDIEIIL